MIQASVHLCMLRRTIGCNQTKLFSSSPRVTSLNWSIHCQARLMKPAVTDFFLESCWRSNWIASRRRTDMEFSNYNRPCLRLPILLHHFPQPKYSQMSPETLACPKLEHDASRSLGQVLAQHGVSKQKHSFCHWKQLGWIRLRAWHLFAASNPASNNIVISYLNLWRNTMSRAGKPIRKWLSPQAT